MSIRPKYIVTFVFCAGAERASSMGVSSLCGRDLTGPMSDIAFRAESKEYTAESILRHYVPSTMCGFVTGGMAGSLWYLGIYT